MILQETFVIYDSKFYDIATDSTTKNSNWTSSNATILTANGYTTISKTNSESTANYTAQATMTAPFIVEWDNHSDSDNDNYVLLDNSNYFGIGITNGVTGECRVKLVVESDTMKLYVNDVLKQTKSLSTTLSSGVTVTLRIHRVSSHSLTYSNFKIYSI